MYRLLKTVHLAALAAVFGGALAGVSADLAGGPLPSEALTGVVLPGMGLAAASGIALVLRRKRNPLREGWFVLHLAGAALTLAGVGMVATGIGLPAVWLPALAAAATMVVAIYKPKLGARPQG